jgi:23S rRNA (cytidine1920-2'-O)/16S rRNA (cytidine1409-2'-O)-methyltransferase
MVEQGLAETRSQAKALIMAGQALADGRKLDKAGEMLVPEAVLTLKDREAAYVSRGGLKLEGALTDLDLVVAGLKVLDIGASTGGFTDCLLKKGAVQVTAVDVGYGILDWRLRQDARVRVMERTNARYLTPEEAGGNFDLAVVDVSFISLDLILPRVSPLLVPGGRILALVKPQFEVGRDKVGKGGVVRDPRLQEEAVEKIAESARGLGLEISGRAPSRLKGPKGNQEHFLLLTLTSSN